MKKPHDKWFSCVVYCVVGCDHNPCIITKSGHVVDSACSRYTPLDEQEYHMDNNPLYNIRPIAGQSTMKPQHEYETVDIGSTV